MYSLKRRVAKLEEDNPGDWLDWSDEELSRFLVLSNKVLADDVMTGDEQDELRHLEQKAPPPTDRMKQMSIEELRAERDRLEALL